MPPQGYRHLSIREEVWELLEEGARRRGFSKVSAYIAYLANRDLELMNNPAVESDVTREYLYAITRADYIPYTLYQELYRAAEDAGVTGDGFDAGRAYQACLEKALESTRLDQPDAEKLCMAIADIALSKAANALVWIAAHRCGSGFRVEITAEKKRGAWVRAECKGEDSSAGQA